MQGELLCMARKMTAGHGDARDLLQETALRALDNEAKYTPGTNLRGWVFTIMQRIFAGRCRRAAYGVVLLPSVCEAFPAASRAEAGGDAEAACDLGAARRAVAVLPASFRVPFALYVSGFRYREIGPKAKNKEHEGDFAPVGGQTLLWATAELSVNLARQIRLACFYDIGNVWEDAYDFDFGELASSVGIGLRFDFIGFPIRMDYAFPIDEDDEWTRERRFVFWIGFDN